MFGRTANGSAAGPGLADRRYEVIGRGAVETVTPEAPARPGAHRGGAAGRGAEPGQGLGARPRARPPEAAEAQRRLADGLQTRVRVEVGKRKGRVVVDFSSLAELERLTPILLGERPPAEPSDVRLD